MTDDMESVLRRSLDEVDRARKRQWAYLVVSVSFLALFVVASVEVSHNLEVARDFAGDYRLSAGVFLGAVISILTNILVILGLSLFINRMTSRILKAIELLSKQ
jgi:hypothetical protein